MAGFFLHDIGYRRSLFKKQLNNFKHRMSEASFEMPVEKFGVVFVCVCERKGVPQICSEGCVRFVK